MDNCDGERLEGLKNNLIKLSGELDDHKSLVVAWIHKDDSISGMVSGDTDQIVACIATTLLRISKQSDTDVGELVGSLTGLLAPHSNLIFDAEDDGTPEAKA